MGDLRVEWIALVFAAHVVGHVALHDGTPASGGIVVGAAPASPADDAVAVIDEHGDYALDVPPGTRVVTVYYQAQTVTRELDAPLAEDATATVNVQLSDPPIIDDPIILRELRPVLTRAEPFGGDELDAESMPIARVRDHDTLVGVVAGADPARATVTLDGGRRLPGAPPIALALLGDAIARTGRVPIDRAAGAGGDLELDSAAASFEQAGGGARIDSDAAVEARMHGVLWRDHAGWSVAGERDAAGGAQLLARVDVQPRWGDDLRVTALHADAPAAALLEVAGIATSPSVRDDFADASWRSRLHDGELTLIAGATAERLGADTTRAAARAGARYYLHAAGSHALVAGGELGGGTAPGAIATRDATAYAGDTWSFTPSLTVDAGVRWDARDRGAASLRATEPRATVAWDWTREGESELSVSAARVASLDTPAPTPTYDELAAGIGHAIGDHWSAGLDVRGRSTPDPALDRRAGADAWLDRRDGALVLHVAASSLERTLAGRAVFTGLCGCHAIVIAVDGRASADPGSSFAGAELAWRHRGGHLTTGLGVEGVIDRAGSLARAVVTIDY
jgi:hypothetical protein